MSGLRLIGLASNIFQASRAGSRCHHQVTGRRSSGKQVGIYTELIVERVL